MVSWTMDNLGCTTWMSTKMPVKAHKLDQQRSDLDTCQERQQVSMLSISEECSIDCGRWPPYVHSSMRSEMGLKDRPRG